MRILTLLFLSTIVSLNSTGQTFTESNVYGFSSNSADAADLDGDFDLDVVFINEQTPVAKLILAEKAISATGQPYTLHIVDNNQHNLNIVELADLDNDLDVDIITGGISDSIYIYLNQGNLTFIKTAYYVGGNITDIEHSDFDNNGQVDILFTLSNINSVGILENLGNATNFNLRAASAFTYSPTKLEVIDFDNNSLNDILVAGYDPVSGNGQIQWIKNNGAFNFVSNPISNIANFDVFPIDLDNDSDMDFVTAKLSNGEFSYWLNNGFNIFTKYVIHTLPSGFGAGAIFAADMDNDGDIDIVGGDKTSGGLFLFKNGGTLNFTINTISSIHQVSSITIFDEDSDGDNDVLISSPNFGPSIFQNNLITIGINEIDGKISFEVAPNPSASFVTVKLDSELNIKNARIVLIDINGQEVYTKNVSDYSTLIDVSKLTSGTYFIKVILSDSVSSERIEVIK